jgi:hypothetical protein
MTLAAVRLAMMTKFATISGITVPQDPLPTQISDKTIMIFPRTGPTSVVGRGASRSLSFSSSKTMDLEYHRRIPYEHLGSTIGDITTMIDTITEMAWGEFASGGGRFDGTVESIEDVALMHFGALGWNEWTFGARMEISFTYLTDVNP